jgi:XTP/dITP diphosphohydrolase
MTEASAGRIVLVLTSPRVSPGLMTWSGWEALRTCDAVLAADPDPAWRAALAEGRVDLEDVGSVPVARRAGRLLEETDGGRTIGWFGSPDGDPGLTDALAEHLSRRAVAGMPPEVELVTASFDVPGSRLLDLVAVMDRLRSPGGCPWDARQTHATLMPHLLEEAHEVLEALESGDPEHLQEELGDLLLQVVFHARLAQESTERPFDVDDVAAGIVAKLVRRHPHVFGDEDAASAEEVERNWEALKAQEKQREGRFDGIPVSLPALARAQKMVGRLARAGRLDPAEVTSAAADPLQRDLLAAVLSAHETGVDAESALRSALGRLGRSHEDSGDA